MLAVSFAVPIEYNHQPAYLKTVEHEAPAEYEFSYAVHDDHTGDIKSQQESRKGDVVHGRYELIDSDGYKRIVEYTADDHNGFNAVVHREPTDIKIPVPVAKVPVSHYAPAKVVQYKPVTQQHYSAPTVSHYSSAPAVSHYSPAPVVHKLAKIVSAAVPQHHYSPAPIAHYSAPAPKYVAPAKVQHSTQHSYEPAHVTFTAPEVNYHY